MRPALFIQSEIAVLVDHAFRQLQEPLIGLWRPPVLQVPFLIMVTTWEPNTEQKLVDFD